jgi:hypothetical protein
MPHHQSVMMDEFQLLESRLRIGIKFQSMSVEERNRATGGYLIHYDPCVIDGDLELN